MSEALKSNVQANGRQPLTAVVNDENPEILGYSLFSTTGDVLVPREWLQEQFEQEGLPFDIFPGEVWPSSAYKRAMARLVSNGWQRTYEKDQKLEFELKNPDDGEANTRHLIAIVYFEGIDDYRTFKLAKFDYDADSQRPVFEITVDEEDQPALYPHAKRFVGRSQGLFQKMKTAHNGQDMRDVLRDLRNDHSTAISLRRSGGLYFFPATYGEHLESLATIWSRMNTYKENGYPAYIGTFPVVDGENRRTIIETRAREMMQEQIDDVIEAGLDALADDEEEAVDEIAERIVESLAGTSDMAQEYSVLLDTRLTVRRHIEDWLDGLSGKKEKMVKKVLEETQ